MVASTLPADELDFLTERAATKQAVVRALPRATHVHLACHAAASFFDPVLDAVLSFAQNETLAAREILDLPEFAPRLLVASACETGVVQGYTTADESLSLATVFIGAGAAGVVATLWAVDDYATALVMSRFYEFLRGRHGEPSTPSPAAALGQAQVWLRELTTEAEDRYLQDRPTLRAHREASRARGQRFGGGPSPDRLFSAPNLWAGFVFTGA